MKKVLVIYYSQSGQLKDIANSIAQPLVEDPTCEVDFYPIKMKNDFPFPWDKESFFGAFPDSFDQIPHEILAPPTEILHQRYDLILLHYQVWYLSPSIPINSFLQSKYADQLLQNTKVITVSGSRNMWVYAQEKMKKILLSKNAILVGNIALTDRNFNLVSVVTVVDWMFSGLKRKAYGIFPLPGIDEKEIYEARKFGEIIRVALQNNHFNKLQTQLVSVGAVEVRWFLVSMDKKANRLFAVWTKIFRANPTKKSLLIKLFNLYLLIVIWLVSPIVHLIETLFYPFFIGKKKREKKYYQGINQSEC